MTAHGRTRRPHLSLNAGVLAVLAIAWLYPLIWVITNSLKKSADIYTAPWAIPWPLDFDNLPQAWIQGQLGAALVNSVHVTTLTVAGVLALSIPCAYALTRLNPPRRALLLLLVLAPLLVPSEVLFIPLFQMFHAVGLLNSLEGLALYNIVPNVALATVILSAFFRTIPRDLEDAARVDGAGRLQALRFVVIPLARPAILAVSVLVGVFTWNDFFGALVLIQRPELFTVQLAISRFSTAFSTDQGLTFAGLAIVIVPPMLLFLLLQRSFVRGLTAGAIRG